MCLVYVYVVAEALCLAFGCQLQQNCSKQPHAQPKNKQQTNKTINQTCAWQQLDNQHDQK
jgi:hypothetical protein